MSKELLIFILILLVGITSLGIVFVGSGEESFKGLCVDGDGDINLEGLMCDKTTFTFFGSEDFYFVTLIFILLGMGLTLIGMFGIVIETFSYFRREEDKNDK